MHIVLIVNNSFLIKYNLLKYVCVRILIFVGLINIIFFSKQQFFFQLIQWFKGIDFRTQQSYFPYLFNWIDKPCFWCIFLCSIRNAMPAFNYVMNYFYYNYNIPPLYTIIVPDDHVNRTVLSRILMASIN